MLRLFLPALCLYMQRCSEMWKSRMSAHLEALGADFLAFLHPGDSWFRLPCGLAHKRCNSARDARLILRGFDETWQAWGRRGERDRVREISYWQGKRLRLEGERIHRCHFSPHKKATLRKPTQALLLCTPAAQSWETRLVFVCLSLYHVLTFNLTHGLKHDEVSHWKKKYTSVNWAV